nr:putative pentatricopeptide repeat-containing protein At5g09950 [Ipomoea batatas]
MPERNVYSWNSMISGYARHGHGHEALEVFRKMKLEGQPPDHVTFVAVLSACSHIGLVEQGFDHFESMSRVYDLTPRIEHFSCMVDLLGRAGELDKMEDFIQTMPLRPNALIWRTVLGVCSRASGRKRDLGRKAAKMLMELEPQNAVNYVLLANMHASGGKWEDVAQARRSMREATARKEKGCSWVSMRDGIHVFVAGDKSHPDTDAIYENLRELHKTMKLVGYVPQIKYALYDLDLENKEELLSYHSERIAVAFVLTRKSEMPIRIMKNLRICGDCHDAFKYISQIVGRKIILRDSIRIQEAAIAALLWHRDKEIEKATQRCYSYEGLDLREIEDEKRFLYSMLRPKLAQKSLLILCGFFVHMQRQDQLLAKAKQKQEDLSKNACFEQIWKSRRGKKDDEALHEVCRLYDVVRVDTEEKSHDVQEEDPELEDHRMMSQYLPLLREIMPSAAEEISLTYMTIFSSEAKADGFLQGGAGLHSCTTPHGPDTKTYEKTIARGNEAGQHRITGTMAFMFESCLVPRVCPWALESPFMDHDYYQCWIGLKSHFTGGGSTD